MTTRSHKQQLARMLQSRKGVPYQAAFKHVESEYKKGSLPRKLSNNLDVAYMILDKTLKSSVTKSLSNDEAWSRSITLGVDSKGRAMELPGEALRRHGVITGSSGSGKTELLKVLAGAGMANGLDVLVLDYRSGAQDPKPLRDFLANRAKNSGVAYQEVRTSPQQSSDSKVMTPWLDLNSWKLTELLAQLSPLDDEYHSSLFRNMLLEVIGAAPLLNSEPTFDGSLERVLAPFRKLSAGGWGIDSKRLIDSEIKPREVAMLLEPSQEQRAMAATLVHKLETMSTSEAYQKTVSEVGSNRSLNTSFVGVTYIGLDVLSDYGLSRLLEADLLLRLADTLGNRVTGKEVVRPLLLLVNEAGWADKTLISNVKSRARGAGLAVVLSAQSPEDYGADYGFDNYARNSDFIISLRQASPKAAEMLSEAHKYNLGLREPERRSEVEAESLRGMGIGEFVLSASEPLVLARGKVTRVE